MLTYEERGNLISLKSLLGDCWCKVLVSYIYIQYYCRVWGLDLGFLVYMEAYYGDILELDRAGGGIVRFVLTEVCISTKSS